MVVDKDRVRGLRLQGLSYSAISKQLGCSINTVRKYCRGMDDLPAGVVVSDKVNVADSRAFIKDMLRRVGSFCDCYEDGCFDSMVSDGELLQNYADMRFSGVVDKEYRDVILSCFKMLWTKRNCLTDEVEDLEEEIEEQKEKLKDEKNVIFYELRDLKKQHNDLLGVNENLKNKILGLNTQLKDHDKIKKEFSTVSSDLNNLKHAYDVCCAEVKNLKDKNTSFLKSCEECKKTNFKPVQDSLDLRERVVAEKEQVVLDDSSRNRRFLLFVIVFFLLSCVNWGLGLLYGWLK